MAFEASSYDMEALGRLEIATERLKKAAKGYRTGKGLGSAPVEIGIALSELRLVASLVNVQWPLQETPEDVIDVDPAAEGEPEGEETADEQLALPVGAGV